MIQLLLTVLAVQSNAELERELYRAQMAAAEAAIRLDEHAEARIWLDRTRPEQRGFEWRVRDASLDESLFAVDLGAGHAAALAASPTQDVVALGMGDGRIELRDSRTGALSCELAGHKESLSYLRFDAAGERVVSASFDRTVKVWSVAERKLLVDFTLHANPVGGAAFSPDGELVASCSYERNPTRGVWGVVHVWNSRTGELVRTLEGGRKPLVGLAFSPNGQRIAAGSWDFCVFVWDVAGGEPTKCAVPDEGIYNAVDDVLWLPGGTAVAGASRDKTARVWNATNGELEASLRGHTDAVEKLALSPDGLRLATASADGALRLWSTSDWRPLATLRGHGDDVVSCAFEREGRALLSTSKDRTLRAWSADASVFGPPQCINSHAVYVARFSPDDSRIATASYDGRITVRDGATLEVRASWAAHPEGQSCHALAWTPDGKRLISGSWEKALRAWDASSGAALGSLELASGTYDLAVSRDGRCAAACVGKDVVVWGLEDYSKQRELSGHSSTVLAVNFSPDSKRCVSAARDSRSIVWDLASGAQLFEVKCADADVADVMFTPDGAKFVVAGRSGAITLHDGASGALVCELASLRHGVSHIDISPDGARLAVASHVLALIDLVHGGVVSELRPHREQPYNLHFDSSGTRIASCSTDKTTVILDTRPLRARLALK